MRAINQPSNPKDPFAGAAKTGKKKRDDKSNTFARNARRNARQQPTRQFNRGR